MTDPASLAAWLAPVLPYLLKGGVELAKSAAGELGKKMSADAWEGLKGLTEKIRRRAEAKPALQEALADVQDDPQDADAIAALRLQLKKLLREDPALRAEAARLLAGVASGGHTIIAAGDRSVAIGGDVSESVIVTGSQNVVQKGASPAPKRRKIIMLPVESSMIEAVGYDEETQRLQVLFTSGRVYCYHEVPPEVYRELMAADSKGQYMRACIIDVYPYTRGACR